MTDIATLGLKIDSTSVTKSNTELDKFVTASGKAKTATDAMAKASETARKQQEQNASAVKDMIETLTRQSDTYGKNASDVRRYEASLLSLTAAEKNQISALNSKLDAQEKASESMDRMKEQATKVGLAIVAAGTAIAAFVKHSIDLEDEMNDLHIKTNISLTDLAAYDLLARKNGTTVQSMADSFKFLQRNMIEHGDELRQLGVTSHDVSTAYQQFVTMLTGIKDPAMQTTLAMQFMGRGASEVMVAMKGGTEAFEEAKRESAGYGKELETAGPLADAFNDRAAVTKTKMQELGAAITNGALPPLANWLEAMSSADTNTARFSGATEIANASVKAAAYIFNILAYSVKETAIQVAGVAAMLDSIAKGNGAGAAAVWRQMGRDSQRNLVTLDVMNESLLENANATDAAGAATSRTTVAVKQWTIAGIEANRQLQDTAKAVADHNAAQKAAEKAYEELQKKAAEYVAGLKLEADQIGLTDGQKEMLKAVTIALTLHTDKEKNAVMLAANAYAVKKDAVAASAKLEKEYSAFIEERIKQNLEVSKSYDKQMSDYDAEIKKLTEKNEVIGLTVEQTNALAIAHIDATLATKQFRLEQLEATDQCTAETEALKDQIQALQKIKGLTATNQIKTATAKAAEDSNKAWTKFTDQIETSLTDSLMRGFEKGKSFAESFVDSLRNTLKSAALKVLVQAFVDPVMGSVRGLFTSGGGASEVGAGSGASGAGSLLGTASNIRSAFSAGSSITSGYASFAGSSIGQGLGLSQGTLMGPTLTGEALSGTAFTAAGQTGASLASGLATAMPYIAAAIIAYQLFASKGGGPKTEGGFQNDGSGAAQANYYRDAGLNELGKGLVEGLGQTYLDAVKELGGTAGQLKGSSFVSQDPKGTANTIFQQIATLNGKEIYNRASLTGGAENVGRDSAALEAEVKRSASVALIAALKDTDGLPQAIHQYLQTVNIAGMTKDGADAVMKTLTTFDTLIDAMKEIGVGVDDLTYQMLDSASKIVDVPTIAANVKALGALKTSFAGLYAQMSSTQARQGMSAMSAFFDDFDKVKAMATGFNATVASVNELGLATQAMYASQLELVKQIADATKQSATSFAASKRTLKLDTLDNQGKYNFFNNEADTYRDVLKTLSDPKAISEYADKLNSAIMSAWGVLDAGQKASNLDAFLTELNSADTLVGGRYSAASTTVGTMTTEITNAINAAFERGIADAIKQITEAKVPLEVAPLTINPIAVGVTVTTNTAASSELTSIGGGGGRIDNGDGGSNTRRWDYMTGYDDQAGNTA